jgi:hypothetical protein
MVGMSLSLLRAGFLAGRGNNLHNAKDTQTITREEREPGFQALRKLSKKTISKKQHTDVLISNKIKGEENG